MFFKQPSSFVREERARGELLVECHRYVNPQVQDQASLGDQVEQNTVGGLSLSKGVTETKFLKIGLELFKLVCM